MNVREGSKSVEVGAGRRSDLLGTLQSCDTVADVAWCCSDVERVESATRWVRRPALVRLRGRRPHA